MSKWDVHHENILEIRKRLKASIHDKVNSEALAEEFTLKSERL